MLFWNGIQSSTTACLVVRSTQAGPVAWTIGGKTHTAEADPGVADGLVRLDAVGLSPDTRYAFSVRNADGETATGSITTFPVDGPVTLGFGSCNNQNLSGGYQFLPHFGVRAFVLIGDETYGENAIFPTVSGAHNISNHYQLHRVPRNQSLQRAAMAHVGMGWTYDDHDLFLDDLTGDLTQLNTRLDEQGRSYTMTLEEADLAMIRAGQAALEYSMGNAPNVDEEADAGALYFRFTAGNTEVFALSAVMPYAPTVGLSDLRPANNWTTPDTSLFVGTKQWEWLQARLLASAARFKLILNPKAGLYAEINNRDGWGRGYDDVDTVLAWVHNSGVKGVIWGTGDFHAPNLQAARAEESGEFAATGHGYDSVHANVSPMLRLGDVRDGGEFSASTRWNISEARTPAMFNNNRYHCFGIVRSTDEHISIEARGTHDGRLIMPTARVAVGSNALTYPRTRIAA
jgi:phosphodiesterase/alkaline phosphatase D-like protein